MPFLAVGAVAGRSLTSDLRQHTGQKIQTLDFDLQFALRGQGQIFIDGAPFDCVEGDLVLIRPGETFEPRAVGDQPFDRFFIHFTPQPIGNVPGATAPWLSFRKQSISARPALRLLVERIIHERYQPDPGKALADLLLTELLLRLATPGIHRIPGPIPQQQQHLLERCCARLGSNFEAQYPLKILADEMGLSVNHFVRLFHRYTGDTPHRYRLSMRLQQGKLLLASGSLSVSEIAGRCGFSDSPHFSSAFRKHFGQSPKAYMATFHRSF